MASEPDVKNDLPIKPNPTATITPVCHKLGEKDYSQAFHASCYSEVNKAVVVLVGGTPKGMTAQAVANHIVKKFESSYVPATAFLRFPETKGVGITYLLNGDAYGPYSGENWTEGFEIVKRHAPQAWYQD